MDIFDNFKMEHGDSSLRKPGLLAIDGVLRFFFFFYKKYFSENSFSFFKVIKTNNRK
jgi:hypothetical protein